MKFCVFQVVVLSWTIGTCALIAGDEPRPSQPNDDKKPNPLQVRCRKMLDMQVAVHDGTRNLHRLLESHAGKKPRPELKRMLAELSKKQKAIIAEATSIIDVLKTDGAAAAFPQVFDLLRGDMKDVRRRLKMSDVGTATQSIETDIIDTLQDMIRALEPCCGD